MNDENGRVALLTGGGGVLCSTIAEGLARQGMRIALLDLDKRKASDVAARIVAAGGEAMTICSSVLHRGQLEDAAAAVVSRFGSIDILINGAGGNHPGATTSPEATFFDLPEDALRFVLDLNVLGTVLPCQVFGRVMADFGQGSIVNIASMNALRPLTRIPGYSAAKAAVANFTQWLAVYMSHDVSPGIRVNAIAPGFFLTEQNRFLLQDKTGSWTPRGRRILDHTPMGRFGAPEDLLSTIVWLVSPASSFVHGIVVPIDGGFSAYSGV